MDKKVVIGHLRSARVAHIKWTQRAKLLISGVEVEEDAIPVNSTECKFGKWFYTDGQKLNAISNNPAESMANIEKLHFELHDTYLNIFTIYFNKPKKGFFAKIFGSRKNSISNADSQKAKEHYTKMENISQDLVDEVNRLERRMLAIPENKLKELI
jgi:hypothetical protein